MTEKQRLYRWVSVEDRYPPEQGYYFWKAKRNSGGYDEFYPDDKDNETHGFLLGDVAYNHISSEYFEWLEEVEQSMTKPFKVGETVPPEFFEMYGTYDIWKNCPAFLDNQDFLHYGQRGGIIESEEEAQRLFEQYLKFLKNKEQ